MADDAKKQAKNRRPGRGGVYPPEEHQFKKGQSGNPNGRPRGKSITARILKIVEQDDGKVADALARAIIKAGLKGDHKFVTTILDRLEGPVEVRHAGADGEPLTVVFEVSKRPDDG